MSTTSETGRDIEARLRAALTARAELVRPEDLRPLAPVVDPRSRWQSPWALLATAAVVLLILGVIFQGLDSRPRSDDLAPKPKEPRVELEVPTDVGRDWKADDLSSPARLDLDGDGVKEKVAFLAEETKDFDGRIRLQTTLSTTGEVTYGIAKLGSTIGTTALEPLDADGDGDQELVLLDELDPDVVGGLYAPVVFDLRDGLLVEAVVEDPDLLLLGTVPVPGSRTDHYDLVRSHEFWTEDSTLFSSRSVDSFARGNMTLMRPESYVADVHEWRLDEDGVLRVGDTSCLVMAPEARVPCGTGSEEGFVPYINSVAAETFGIGEGADFREGYRFNARLEAFADPSLVVEGDDGRTVRYDDFGIPDPRVSAVQPMGVDGASLFVTSASDPAYVAVLAQDGDQLRALRAAGEINLLNEGGVRTWLTRNGALVTVTATEDGSWTAWTWMVVSRTEMAALPWGTVCFDDVDDPATARSC
jgi:hypothetical protein